MFREMLRKKQLLTQEECLAILKNEPRGVLSVLGDDGYPYGMPMNHFYCEADGKIYFHGGRKGHKIDAMMRHGKASFCVYDRGFRREGDWALNIKSVIVFGHIEFVEDQDKLYEIALRESLSYFGLYRKMFQVRKKFEPVKVSYGTDREQYFLYYEPDQRISDKILVWVHGGGWNAGNPRFFDFVGQCVCEQGYRFVSLGYRLSPKHKYPCQIRDVCEAYNAAIRYLTGKGVDTSRIIAAGPSAGAHLTSILCYCREVQEEYGVDVSDIIGFIGTGGPYSFRDDQGLALRLLLNQLFEKGYDRRNAEPVFLMGTSRIPMLLIQSRHDGLVGYACAEDFARRAKELGNECELYSVTDRKNTHSWYTAGMFLESREENKGLDKFFSWIEQR